MLVFVVVVMGHRKIWLPNVYIYIYILIHTFDHIVCASVSTLVMADSNVWPHVPNRLVYSLSLSILSECHSRHVP